MNTPEKKTYETPTLAEYGDLITLTQDGTATGKDFTLKSDSFNV